MKKALLVLILVLGINYLYSQNDCSYGNGTFRYEANLNIENVPSGFDKDDFIEQVILLEEISSEDLTTLNTHIISVNKIWPSYEPNKRVVIVSTLEIYPVLDELNILLDHLNCVFTDCMHTNGTFHYYALMISSIPNDFDKEDFIDYITAHENISNEDLSTLNTHITSLEKAFPTSQSELLQRILSIEATFEIYFILAELTNTLEHHECNPEPVLGMNNFEIAKITLYPNPVADILTLNSKESVKEITIYDMQGKQLNDFYYNSSNTITKLDVSALQNGIYFLKIETESGRVATEKFIKK